MSSRKKALDCAILLEPKYRDYVWGGDRLLPGKSPIAEAWVIFEGNSALSPLELRGFSLAEITERYGEALLGRRSYVSTGRRFPLLIKLLDCAAWLSLQVHPNDVQASQLEGPGFYGKTEAWHFLDAAPNAEILCGLLPGTTFERVAASIKTGTFPEIVRHLRVKSGESILIPPGTIHALGPGLLGYEVQQNSNVTYRAFDWNRPATPERPLHVEKTLAVADLGSYPDLIAHPSRESVIRKTLIACDYFTLDLLQSDADPFQLDTAGASFHAITIIKGKGRVSGKNWSENIDALDSILIPAQVGNYSIQPDAELEALLAYIE